MKNEEKIISTKKILSALNKGAVKFESGYHFNKSTGAESDEYHFRAKYNKRVIYDYEFIHISDVLEKLDLSYRTIGANIYIKVKI